MNRSTPAVRWHGHIDQPAELTVQQLRALPSHHARVTFDCRTSWPQHHTFEGPRLWDVLHTTRPRPESATRKARLGHLLTVTGADGHFALLSWAEIDPEFSGQQFLLATSIDGRPLDATGPQLVVPTDSCGARYISAVTAVWVGPLHAWQPAAAATPACVDARNEPAGV
ncbi:molybdopterin-dependent oxidoreductase [Streptacidiphilus sp. EB129]|uniref:molybdopterin-dependent oxidoreductase n=1 Tax=Streptacidiphilus sp. EB129 TaxID=3156262 RepID=UPI0035185932